MRRIWSLLCSLLLIVQICPVPALATTDCEYCVEAVYPRYYESSGGIATVADSFDVDALKAVLLTGLQNCDAEIDISSFNIPPNTENVNILSNLIFSEIPEAFHVKTFYYSFTSGKMLQIRPIYLVSQSEYKSMLSDLMSAKNELLRGIKGNENLDDVEKALLLHDRLALVCQYDYNQTANRHNVYGALVDGTAVCQGYAVAYDYLLEEVGISGYLCVSDQLNHAWNIVYINNTPYHVDVTWDDMAWASGSRGVLGAVWHDNFLRSTQGIYATEHQATDYDTSPSDTTYDNYFWRTSQTAFQLVGNELYYIDHEAEMLKKYSDGAELCSVASYWPYQDRGYWSNQARLSGDGKNLYYSLADAVYQYNVATGESDKILQPKLDKYTSIYGLAYSDGNLICDISDAAPCSGLVNVLYQFKQMYPSAAVEKWNIALSDDINANFYLAVDDAVVSTAKVKISVADESVTRCVADLEKVDGLYKVCVDLAAAQMNDRISVQLLDGENEITASSYTIRQYCLDILADSSRSEYHTLVKRMLHYGAMAQRYFDYCTNELADGGIADTTGAELPESTVQLAVGGEINGVNFHGASLVYRDRIAVRYYFTGNVTDCTFTANGNTYVPTAKDGMHYVEIADILPQNLDQRITLTVTDASGNTLSVTYGPMNYIVRMNQKGDTNTQNLMKALYNYHIAAKAMNS